MKIAVSKDGNFVSRHFGHCEGFEVIEVENNEIKNRDFLVNPGHRPGFLPNYLSDNGINVIIAGGMGEMAQQLFGERNIQVIVGVDGEIETAVNNFINGKLKSTESVCREHQHHGEGCNH